MAWKDSDDDRRKQKREKIQENVTVITPELSLEATMEDISGDGMGIVSFTCIDPKTEIIVVLELEEDKRLNEKVQFHGKIVWALGDYVGGKFVYRMGMETRAIRYKEKVADNFQRRQKLGQELITKLRHQAKNTRNSETPNSVATLISKSEFFENKKS